MFRPQLEVPGVQVQQVWAGDLYDEQCFARPARVTLGPRGTFTIPSDGQPASGAVALLQPLDGGFGLCLDVGEGWLETGGIRRSFAELRALLQPLMAAPVVRLAVGTRAAVTWGAFSFEIEAVALPVPLHEPLRWRTAVPLLLSLAMATLSTVGPLLLGLTLPSDRVQPAHVPKATDEVPLPAYPLEAWVEPPQALPAPEADARRTAPEAPAIPESPPLAPPTVKPAPPKPRLTKDDVHRAVDQVVPVFAEPAAPRAHNPLAVDDPHAPPGAPTGESLLPNVGESPRDSKPETPDDGPQQPARVKVDVPTGPVTVTVRPAVQRIVPFQAPDTPSSPGGLSQAEVRGVLAEHHGLVRHCYQNGLQRNPELQGRLKMVLVIGPTGQVLQASVEHDEVDDSEVTSCIAAAMRSLRFPSSRDGQPTRVGYPIVLRAR